MSALVLLYLLTFCRASVGLLFAVSFIGKVRNIPLFAQTIARFNLLPGTCSRPAALVFLGGELAVVGSLLVGGSFLGPGFWLAGALLLLFSLALVLVLVRHTQTSCNCFGATVKPVSVVDLGRNAGFMLCTLVGGATLGALNSRAAPLGLADEVLALLGATFFVAVFLNLGEIMYLFRQR